MPWWFGPDEARDAWLRDRFGSLAEACAAGRHNDWADEPAGRLALSVGRYVKTTSTDKYFQKFHKNLFYRIYRSSAVWVLFPSEILGLP